MVDMARQANYWRQSSDEDWEVAQELVGNGRTRHGLFFAHLALEKLLKAFVCLHPRNSRRTGISIMAQTDVAEIVKQYVQAVQKAGLPVSKAILFGSYAQNTAHKGSDIDILIVSPVFDQADEGSVDLLWELRAVTDPRIEPVACGQVQWETDGRTWLLQMARDSGVVVV
jgi:predicted nucleotidyltransferase